MKERFQGEFNFETNTKEKRTFRQMKIEQKDSDLEFIY